MSASKNKTVENNGSVEEFLDKVTDEKRRVDALEVCKLMEELTGTNPKMWGSSMVGYGSYHYKYDSGREGDMMKLGFSPRKTSLVLYIMPGFERYDDLMRQLGKYTTGKSCLYIKKLEDVDPKIMEELIRSSWDYMTKKYG